MSEKLKSYLRQHVEFLARSSALFDSGHEAEAFRISVSLRVLFHQTAHSNSLINQLKSGEVELLSTVGSNEISENTFVFEGMGVFSVGSGGKLKISPNVELPDNPVFVSLPKWWNQVVYVADKHRLSRRSIVLAAANKDGGAHVDMELPEDYLTLAEGRSLLTGLYIKDGIHVDEPFLNRHVVALRQMAFEVLNSPSIARLLSERA